MLVRTPQARDLAALIGQRLAGVGSVQAAGPGELYVIGLTAAEVGDLAFENQIRLHELATKQASLEDAFLEITGGAAGVPGARAPPGWQQPGPPWGAPPPGQQPPQQGWSGPATGSAVRRPAAGSARRVGAAVGGPPPGRAAPAARVVQPPRDNPAGEWPGDQGGGRA